MARLRNHKAEYAAAKARANKAGYSSQREYKKARKDLGLKGGGVSPLHKATKERMYPAGVPSSENTYYRVASKLWSDKHSRNIRSRFNPQWDDVRVKRYYDAFVADITGGGRKTRNRIKKSRIHDWLVPDWMEEAEWEERYSG